MTPTHFFLHPTTSNYVDQIAFSPDGKLLASYHSQSSEIVNLWDVASGQKLYAASYPELWQIPGCSRIGSPLLLFSSDGKSLTFSGFILDLKRGRVINQNKVKVPFDLVSDLAAVSPDLQMAIGKGNKIGTMVLWETSTEKEIYTLFLGHSKHDRYYSGWENYINLFSPDGRIFASLIWFRGGSDFYPDGRDPERIKLWEVETGMELCNILLPNVTAETKYTGTLAFSSDGRILAHNCGDTWREIIVLSEAATGQELCRFKGKGKVVSLAFSPDDQILASGYSAGNITLWQLIWEQKNGQSRSLKIREIRTFIGSVSYEPIRTLAFTPDGKTLASGAGDHNRGITLWDVKSGKKHKTFPGHSMSKRVCSESFLDRDEIAISPNGNIIAHISYSGYLIKLRDTQSHALLRCFKAKGLGNKFCKVAFSQDGNFLVGVCNNVFHRINLCTVTWEVATGKRIRSIEYSDRHPIFVNLLSKLARILGFQGIFESVMYRKGMLPQGASCGSRTVNQYGDLLAVFRYGRLPIRVLHARTGKTVCTLTGDHGELWQIVFSPDKRLIATRHSMSRFALWEIATGRLISILNTENSEYDSDPGDPEPILFSPDGEFLAIAGARNITLWEVSSGEKIHTIDRYHSALYSCMAFSPNGQTLAFSECNGTYTINLWDAETGNKTCILEPTLSMIQSLDFSANGQFLVSSFTDGSIRVWQRSVGSILFG
ncbi:MAG: WD40 repeat domain-containing protein [Xenococcaceae cyanobacterium MO_234.B1]|nr:WD40 repeat domain-containing protein [Xenococcaceae cyanobacterium MO_234.B1]